MKGVVALILMVAVPVLSGCGRAPDDGVLRKFQEAQQAFDRALQNGNDPNQRGEQFLRAALLYQEILDGGFVSGAVLYNQGNAFMGAGQRGRAIACYRQAKRYLPRDPLLDLALRTALDTDDPRGDRALVDYVLFWQDWISYGGKFRLAGGMAVLAFLVAFAALFAGRRRWVAYCGWAALALTLLVAASAAYDWYRFDGIKHGVVVAEQVVARKGNADSFEPAFTQPLAEGTEFVVMERRGDWFLIGLPGAKEGWVKRDEVVVY